MQQQAAWALHGYMSYTLCVVYNKLPSSFNVGMIVEHIHILVSVFRYVQWIGTVYTM
jgi:hypothetical protein